jgi:outer membrane protein assembly factor BamB
MKISPLTALTAILVSMAFCISPSLAEEKPVVADWPHLLGLAHNCTTPESGLLRKFPADGLRAVWEMPLGSGMGGPAIVGGRIVVFHRVEEKETVECRDAATGKPQWKFAYEAPYRPRYGGGSGPRTSPVIADGRVFTFGVTGKLHCIELASGKVIWGHDCAREYAMKPAFFGFGSTPLVLGSRVIVQIGGVIDGKPVNSVAFDTATGKLLWTVAHEWGASYASPVPAQLHGRDCVLIFAGGMSRPATGGLLVVDAADGKVLAAAPHRAAIAESVNVSSPVVASAGEGKDARIFVSEVYTAGGLCVELAKDFAVKTAWQAGNFGMYWMTPLVREGCIFGFTGQSEQLAELTCYDIAAGRELWRDDLGRGFGRANLLATADGVLCLGEFGDLAWIGISPKGGKVLERTKLFDAPETWTPPALSHGLLYVQQNEPDHDGKRPRMICYDLRAK